MTYSRMLLHARRRVAMGVADALQEKQVEDNPFEPRDFVVALRRIRANLARPEVVHALSDITLPQMPQVREATAHNEKQIARAVLQYGERLGWAISQIEYRQPPVLHAIYMDAHVLTHEADRLLDE